jgi:hypothetical protein
MPTLQATVRTAFVPIGVPVRSPRSGSVSGGEGLVVGELAESGRHRGDEHEAAAEEWEEGRRALAALG